MCTVLKGHPNCATVLGDERFVQHKMDKLYMKMGKQYV